MIHGPIVIGDTPSTLIALGSEAVRAAVWRRPNPAAGRTLFETWASPALSPTDPFLPQWLKGDLEALSRLYTDVSGQACRARLDVVTDQACPKFHEDANRLRLLVTYDGPGTEWCLGGADPQVVGQAGPGWVLALKGSRQPGGSVRVLHRSPALKPGEVRWILTLDAAIRPAEQQAHPEIAIPAPALRPPASCC